MTRQGFEPGFPESFVRRSINWAICIFPSQVFVICSFLLERSKSETLGLGRWAIWWWWLKSLNQCDRHIPKNKNYWRKSKEYKFTWSYFDQSQVRISELWAGITVWGVSGLLASHTLIVWSPVLKKKIKIQSHIYSSVRHIVYMYIHVLAFWYTPEAEAKDPGICGDHRTLYTIASCPRNVVRDWELEISHWKHFFK